MEILLIFLIAFGIVGSIRSKLKSLERQLELLRRDIAYCEKKSIVCPKE